MMDDTKLGGLLRNAAAGDPMEAIDPEQVVRRGERGLRRRRAVGVTGAAVAVAAVTWGATSLTDIDSSDGTPPVAETQSTEAVATELFKPIPGVARGDAALGQLSDAEAVRRCKLRHPQEKRKLMQQWGGFRGGGSGIYDLGPHLDGDPTQCSIPGDSQPTAHAIALSSRDRFPASDAGRLRNCSVRLWHDITGWRILTSETEPGALMNLVAISPSGHYAARCSLTTSPNADGVAGTGIGDLVNARPAPPGRKAVPARDSLEHFPVAGSQMCRPRTSGCLGWLHDEIGRVDSKIAKIRVVKPNGRVHDIKVVDGWYAFAWADRDPRGGPDARVTTYDASGKVLKSYN